MGANVAVNDDDCNGEWDSNKQSLKQLSKDKMSMKHHSQMTIRAEKRDTTQDDGEKDDDDKKGIEKRNTSCYK